ncbi:MAG: VTT domain-containing protein [Deltaproteobacteria bacterium]|nr:VTT domain-containing protein [Deltaproteobacteria bacterium]
MDSIVTLLHQIYDVRGIIEWGGLVLLTAIVFTETGLMFGFFLPGDSLLVTAGIFAAAGALDITAVIALLTAAAVSGDQLGYYLGCTVGPRIFNREDSLFFHRRHAERAQRFYDRHGGKTIILARFIPIIRTFAPVVAGVGKMEYRRFVAYNVIGGVSWVWGLTLGGYALGRSVPNIEKNIHLVIAIVIFLSILPGVVEFAKAKLRPAAN